MLMSDGGRRRVASTRRSRSSDVSGTLVVAHQWTVMLVQIRVVLPLPARAAEILEAVEIATEVGSLLDAAASAERVLQVRIHLHLLGELGRLDLNEGGSHGLHVRAIVVERDAAGSDGVLELVRIDPSVQNSSKKIIHDVGKPFSVQHAVQGSNEDCFLWVQALSGRADVVAITVK